MADRGQSSRDDEPRPIPVSELLAASKRSLAPLPELPVDARPSAGLDTGSWFGDASPGASWFDDAAEQTSTERPDIAGVEQADVEHPGEIAADPAPAHAERTAVVVALPVAELVGKVDAGPAGGARRARALPLVLGAAATVAALTGVLVITDALTDGGPDTATIAGPTTITGAEVFRPDLIRASLDSPGDTTGDSPGTDQGPGEIAGPGDAANGSAASPAAGGATAAEPGSATPEPRPQPQPQTPAGSRPEPQPEPEPEPEPQRPDRSPPAPDTNGPHSQEPTTRPGLLDSLAGPLLDPILGFYAAAPDDPARAFALLAPSLRVGTVDDFARSWADVRDAEVRAATVAGDDTLVVDVLLVRDDGSTLLTTQRVVVDDGARPTILDARLIAADRG